MYGAPNNKEGSIKAVIFLILKEEVVARSCVKVCVCSLSATAGLRGSGRAEGVLTLLLPILDTVELVHARTEVGGVAAERDLE